MADDEFSGQMPGLSQRIVVLRRRFDRLVIAPIGNNMDARRRNAKPLDAPGHQFADHHGVIRLP